MNCNRFVENSQKSRYNVAVNKEYYREERCYMSKEYVIMTDSSCDLPQELADQLGLEVLPLEVMADGKNYRNWLDGREIGFKEFYKLARE